MNMQECCSNKVNLKQRSLHSVKASGSLPRCRPKSIEYVRSCPLGFIVFNIHSKYQAYNPPSTSHHSHTSPATSQTPHPAPRLLALSPSPLLLYPYPPLLPLDPSPSYSSPPNTSSPPQAPFADSMRNEKPPSPSPSVFSQAPVICNPASKKGHGWKSGCVRLHDRSRGRR